VSFKRLLKKLYSGKADVEELQSLQRLGITSQLNYMLLARLEDLSKKLEEIEDNKERDPMLYIEQVDRLIRTDALPWFRAADSPPLAKALEAWTGLVGMAKWLWNALSRGESEESIRKLRERFNNFLVKNLYPAADVMLALSFRSEDIAPQYVNVVRSNVGAAGGGFVVPTEMERKGEE